ncbi:MAG TPA: DsbA family protein, partial [Gemmatimonadota bacterium]|nr:DsbA family protein [Gemmatimonadota bacterium]
AALAALAAALAASPALPAQPAPARGPEGAALEIVEFSDFQCPFCAEARPVIDSLLAAHPDGVRHVYRHFPLPMHEHAARAAQASIEAGLQGAFWPYHDRLFENQAALSDAELVEHAEDLGLDGEAFERALASASHQARMHEDMELGRALGVTGTPTLFLNGFRFQGVPSVWMLEIALEAFRTGLVAPRSLVAGGEPPPD